MTRNSKPIVSSLETEYAVADGINAERSPADVCREIACRMRSFVPTMRAASQGYFTANGSRVYVDSGHLEIASPECGGAPEELIAYRRAGDALLAKAIAGSGLVAWRNTVCPDGGATWGTHENVMIYRPPERLARPLLAFLATRCIWAGAGGLDWRNPGIRFALSPRTLFFSRALSGRSPSTRALISLRENHHAVGVYRLHVTCRDTLHADLAEYLAIGVTRLVVRLADLGFGIDHVLADPMAAVQQSASDVSCCRTLTLESGKTATAIDVQRRYLDLIRQHYDVLPDWGEQVANRLEWVLDALEADPAMLAGRIDWATRKALFDRRLEEEDGELIDEIAGCLRSGTPTLAPLSDPWFRSVFPGTSRRRLMRRFGKRNLMHFQALREYLITLDREITRVGTAALETVLNVDRQFVTTPDVEKGIYEAPSTTRARARGRAIRQFEDDPGSRADWSSVRLTHQILNLPDPVATDGKWVAS